MPSQGEHGLRFFLAHLEPISLLLQAAPAEVETCCVEHAPGARSSTGARLGHRPAAISASHKSSMAFSRVLRWHLQVAQPLVLLNQPRCGGLARSVLPRSGGNSHVPVPSAGRCSLWQATPARAHLAVASMEFLDRRTEAEAAAHLADATSSSAASSQQGSDRRGSWTLTCYGYSEGFALAGAMVESHQPGGRRDTPEAEDVADSQLLSVVLFRIPAGCAQTKLPLTPQHGISKGGSRLHSTDLSCF